MTNRDELLTRPELEKLSQLELVSEYRTIKVILSETKQDFMSRGYLVSRLNEIEDMLPEDFVLEEW